jgi:hypothetical protein
MGRRHVLLQCSACDGRILLPALPLPLSIPLSVPEDPSSSDLSSNPQARRLSMDQPRLGPRLAQTQRQLRLVIPEPLHARLRFRAQPADFRHSHRFYVPEGRRPPPIGPLNLSAEWTSCVVRENRVHRAVFRRGNPSRQTEVVHFKWNIW